MNWLAKIIGVLMPNCREALRLQSDALDRPLSRWQLAGLQLHLLLCKWCRRYGRQIAFLRAAAHGCEDVHTSDKKLPLEARERIKQTLKSGKNSPD